MKSFFWYVIFWCISYIPLPPFPLNVPFFSFLLISFQRSYTGSFVIFFVVVGSLLKCRVTFLSWLFVEGWFERGARLKTWVSRPHGLGPFSLKSFSWILSQRIMLCSGVEGLSRECPKASNVPVPCSDLTFTSADLTKTILSSDRHMFFLFYLALLKS